jgi:probable O-glycosylation ligase (exosortase A-associated)
MRDYIILAVILASVPICLFNPYFGVLMWSWIAYFNPHRFAWGIAYNFPVATAIAVPTLVGTIFVRKMNRRFLTREMGMLLLLWIWFAYTVFHATQEPLFYDHIREAQNQLATVSKVLLMTVLTVLLVTSVRKLKYLLLVTSLSFGILGIKGALFGLRTGGEFSVYGPPDSFVADNNDLALALNISLPMLFYLARREETRWLRNILWAAFFCSVLSVLLTYSRGGLLGLAVVMSMIAVKARKKALAITLLIICVFLVLTFAPGPWLERMGIFLTGNLDESAQGRLNAWHFAWVLATNYPLTGGGFETFTPGLFERFTPDLKFAGPHSIYFQVLGEQGFVGLGLFLTLLAFCWFTLRKLRRSAQRLGIASWVMTYTDILQASLLAYLVSGAFLPRAYFDLFYQLVASVIIVKILYRREVAAVAARMREPEPALVDVGELVVS